MKILINTPDLGILGGVCNHYNGLKLHWKSDVKYNTIGHRYGFSGILILPFDIIKFIFRIIFFKPHLILLNPSLIKRSVNRDSVFLHISKFLNVRTVVFFHGWDKNFESEIDNGDFKFKEKYKKADSFIVLSEEFKNKLIQWGVNKEIFLSTTKVDDHLLSNYDINKKSPNKSILFLSRIEKNKGIYIALETHRILKERHPNLNLTIAGDGSELNKIKKYVKVKKIKDVNFLGRISGKQLTDVFYKNSVYLFPTYHGEGMPTSVLEAMAFGLTIFTRPIGGVNDFFIDKKMGRVTESLNSECYASLIEDYFLDLKQLKKSGEFNHKFALNNFMASVVSKQMENIFKNIINN